MPKLNRRQFITTAGAAALTHATIAKTQLNSGVYAGYSDTPEVTTATLGFLPVTSCCPLIIAKAKGFFAQHGMPDINVVKQPSWAVMRDKLILGAADEGLDGGHLLFPMVYLMATGEISYGRKIPMYILARMNVNGQGISVANSYKNLNLSIDSSPLKSAFAQKTKTGETVRCAVPYRRVTGDFFMRWWLAYGGIDPDRDLSVIVIAPPQMVASMRSGSMEAFCVVDPWHHRLIKQGLGYSTVTTGELWPNHPEKALGVRAEWVDKYPKAAKAMLAAFLEAQIWCDKPENKAELLQIVSERQWIGVKSELTRDRLLGKFDYGNGRIVENSPHAIKYWRKNASYPFKSHDLWFLIEDMRWGYRSPDFDTKPLIDAVNREDLWREAAKLIGQESAIPASTSRGVEKFFNGLEFNPENPQAYLNTPKIRIM
ncbi:CmpA/NrtA family ABC transporter substrate-binding protein [Anabaena sp. FACHB-709]|uniref:Nitrate-binding protein NrtA n=2 Tax=Nostocaceae TaxID=1162 RepID=A0A1Z4KJ12_ANAVA|nr:MULTISPECIES: CmpA/NrtA family ABC transporter substrate-binding protein [Nostocaceae]BAY68962.1 nitrate-binding protein NrtA [Trichormus variabilis NIES-23]HBW33467.1 bicarbonate-binding protein [Nostoc sp. UBA8866]MBD2170534.1 ABC transporter substrate-binding protein [Anabaena cylindrica FACHB-318]MBD2261990.1 ABC transporter substrate-binding protein [Anabaena sp. FACHB-709]MBD2271867.1 ABC transporter substrate-binding protein [Nostoc sp. PCC 7120 = FACHB-418]